MCTCAFTRATEREREKEMESDARFEFFLTAKLQDEVLDSDTMQCCRI
jgi:hypothetical protein